MDEQIVDGLNLAVSLQRCLIAFVLVIAGFVFIPWQFRLPVSGELILSPAPFKIQATRSGMIRNLLLQEGQLVVKGQTLFVLEPSQGLINSSYYQQKLKHSLQKLKQETQERNYQRERLLKFKNLLTRQTLSHENYHEFESQFRQIELARQNTLEKMTDLRRQQKIKIQAPISGKILGLRLANNQYLPKDEMILSIKPRKQQWLFQFKVPVTKLRKVHLGSELHLSLPYHAQAKRYRIQAKVTQIGRSVHVRRGQAFVMVFAKIINPRSDFLVKLPLDGYLLGVSQSWLSWILQWIVRD
jgi:multidrug efflux pump subunit AcrA (membrane-fusion protein)